ncbi:MAG: sodium:calcium antiporter [Candidatus Omnitrophica bacterium]|nr:sodium:calcium antiporter [Candidatus Omnitrophota bacterium]
MVFSALSLLLGLVVILFAAEWFTNGVEVLGRKFSFSQAVVGSILAAVGTALPETILPVVAIFSSDTHSARDIGVGAILGAPFMLATIGFFLIGLTALVSSKRGRREAGILVEPQTLKRDLSFFIVMYAMAIGLPLVFGRVNHAVLAVLLVLGYFAYVSLTIHGESAQIEHLEGLHLLKFPRKWRWTTHEVPHFIWIALQIVLSLAVMVWGAHIFVKGLETVSLRLGLSPLLFALLVAPVATELPEKFNSVTWVLKKKDSLAVGNITGAMVFQATFPVSVGLLFTEWKIAGMALVSAGIAMVSAGIVLVAAFRGRKLSPALMMLGGVLYVLYAMILVFFR